MSYTKMWAREYSVQYCESFLRSVAPNMAQHIYPILDIVFFPEQQNEACYVESVEYARWLYALQVQYSSSKSVQDFVALLHQRGTSYVNLAQEIGTRTKKAQNSELAHLHQQYAKELKLYTAYLYIGFQLSEVYGQIGHELLSKKELDPAQANHVSNVLFSPTERVGILKLQDVLAPYKRAGLPLSPHKLSELAQEYAWMACVDAHNDPWTDGDIIDLYEHLSLVEPPMSFAAASKLAKFTKQEQETFSNVRQISMVKDIATSIAEKAFITSCLYSMRLAGGWIYPAKMWHL